MLTPDDYLMALHSQSASNLSGLVHSLSMVLEGIWEEARAKGEGTDFVNGHPIVRLYIEQLNHLCRGEYAEAYRICVAQANKATQRSA